jgi:hypothetical protein
VEEEGGKIQLVDEGKTPLQGRGKGIEELKIGRETACKGASEL